MEPTTVTVALTLTLLAAGVALSLRLPDGALLAVPEGSPTTFGVLALGLLFFLTELGQARIEIRRQAYSFSLSGVPLLLGLLYVSPAQLIAIRLAAAVLAFAVQRVPPVKFAFNTAAYGLDVAAVLTLSHALVREPAELTLATAALCYVALAAVDLLMSAIVLLVIRVNGGPVGREDVAEVALSAGGFVALNTAIGLVGAVLVTDGSLGAVLLVGLAAVSALSYRAYLVLRRRHRSLQDLQDFIRLGEGPDGARGLNARMLPRVRELLNAGRVELVIDGADGDPDTVLVVDESGVLEVAAGRPGTAGRTEAAADDTGSIRVPLEVAGATGTLTTRERLGDHARFTADDHVLLRTLGGHLAVALHSARLLERLRDDATRDSLTGLPNRALLGERLQELLAVPHDAGRVAVLVLDLDRFKEVNDAFGHASGDRLLQAVAARLTALVPAGAMVGRLGGDEFSVVLAPSQDPERDAVALAGHIARALTEPVDLGEAAVTTGACVGVGVGAPGLDGADLLRHADTAMYAAKDARLPVVVHSDSLDEGRRERLAMLVDMRAALDAGEFRLEYQPKVDLASGVVTSVEALVRWTHPVLGPVPPDVFIPVAESTGLIDELTRTVLRQALDQCRRWREDGHDLTVAVNLSARNVNDEQLPERIAAALALAGVPADRLILEITESSVMGDPRRTVPTLERLAALGVTLSLDDFGTGYSSLSYLQRLPVRELKIDRSFLVGMAREAADPGDRPAGDARSRDGSAGDDLAGDSPAGDSPRDRSARGASEVLVRSIVGLAHSLGLRVVAEGVETPQIMAELRALGCDLAQGYLVSRPVHPRCLVDVVHRAGYRTAGTTRAAQAAVPTPRGAAWASGQRVPTERVPTERVPG
ncbi:bifunctional diguanylate cyclase/phosphodiesterase [Cellulomonas sp. ATA003]|uniref:putative bifunctional diguanylate cyclase/phosphodiesterase n=1 Tax=Cellulomonas sp. ATA003 TaxID=3073064 RepID=UPI0028730356|nr:bifunctional diguanylate cyclase/phosphodiesterase [Cellulomonas sp. ATA003]WNB87184.1 bifunctional diguanylate cyclase/phosphodiesterase [Cellulomonas sp. ATA003]